MQFAMSVDSIMLSTFFSTEVTQQTLTIKTLLHLYPPFTYSVLFMQIMRVASTHFNSNYQTFVEGVPFSLNELNFEERDFFVTTVEYHVTSALNSFCFLFLDLLIYSFLAWYCDHIVTNNRGHKYNWFFCFGKEYWINKFSTKEMITKRYRKHSDEYLQGHSSSEEEN